MRNLILKDIPTVLARIHQYNSQPEACVYNRAYHSVLEARQGSLCLVDKSGSVSDPSIETIRQALLAFDMGRQVDRNQSFNSRLRAKLNKDEVKMSLTKFREYTISSPKIAQLETDVENVYEVLSASGEDSLSKRHDHFYVGATKTLNFMFPELFVIVDSNVKMAVHRSSEGIEFGKYWDIMILCGRELFEWEQHYGDLDSLLRLDTKPTTITRIFDKCAFVLGKSGG